MRANSPSPSSQIPILKFRESLLGLYAKPRPACVRQSPPYGTVGSRPSSCPIIPIVSSRLYPLYSRCAFTESRPPFYIVTPVGGATRLLPQRRYSILPRQYSLFAFALLGGKAVTEHCHRPKWGVAAVAMCLFARRLFVGYARSYGR